jgi:CRISPR-associated protein Cmr3
MRLLVTPLDSWFFRDSTPFYMGASPQAGVRGVFPPYPSTVTGAIRAALARSKGWNGEGSWGQAIKDVLGDGPDDLGKLKLSGPFVVRCGQPIFSMPRHVVGHQNGDGRWVPTTLLRAGKSRISSDLGPSTRLPEIAGLEGDAKTSEWVAGSWITLGGLLRVLHEQMPAEADILHQDELWREELHVGIRRDLDSRATSEGALYSARHARLSRGVGIGVEIAGVPDDWTILPGSLLPLGGESRLAECEPWDFDLSLELDQAARALSGWIMLIALTPALLECSALRGNCDLIAGTGLRVTCACVDRPVRIGGWDSLARKPLPLQNAVPCGTTLFCRVGDPSALRQQIAQGTVRMGKGQSIGFGLFAIGGMSG